MNFITVKADNIHREHICCTIADKKARVACRPKRTSVSDNSEALNSFIRIPFFQTNN